MSFNQFESIFKTKQQKIRKEKLQKEHDNTENLDVKKNKGARLKQIKECIDYINTH